MAQQPIGLFGLKLVPGEEYDLDVFDDVRITNISFGENVVGNARTVVKIHHRSVPSFYDDEEDESDFDSEESLSEEEDSEDVDQDEEAANTSKASATKANGVSKKQQKANEMAALMEGLTGNADEEEGDDEDEDDDEDDEDDEEEEEQTFVICSLYPGKLEQATVDLHISTEDQVRFSITGDNPVELLGSYLSSGRFDDDPDSDELIDSSDEDSDEYSDSDDEEIDSDELEMLEAAAAEDDDSEGSDEIDLDDLNEEELALLKALQDDESDEDDDEDMDDSDERFEEVSGEEDDDDKEEELAEPTPVKGAASKKRSAAELEDDDDDEESAAVTDAQIAKEAKALGLDASKLTKNQRKKLNKRLRAADTSAADDTQESVEVKQAKDGKTKVPAAKKEESKVDGKTQSKKVPLPSGVVIEDVKVGSGAAAKAGNRLGMRYVGRLQNGKQFDANTKGKPFTFKLGKGDVIGGWDEGLKGMKVGGERRLIIPPKMGYGSRGAPPDIPGNATLVFDVKLVEIK